MIKWAIMAAVLFGIGRACSEMGEAVEARVAADMRPREAIEVVLAVDAASRDEVLPGVDRMDLCAAENAEHRWVFEHEMGVAIYCHY